jgi:hypothetical protein
VQEEGWQEGEVVDGEQRVEGEGGERRRRFLRHRHGLLLELVLVVTAAAAAAALLRSGIGHIVVPLGFLRAKGRNGEHDELVQQLLLLVWAELHIISISPLC